MTTKSVNLLLDTEFTNFESLQLISIGIISDKSHELYLESTHYAPEYCSEFVQEIVLPKLTGGEQPMSESKINTRQE
jgi:hypothetical protein